MKTVSTLPLRKTKVKGGNDRSLKIFKMLPERREATIVFSWSRVKDEETSCNSSNIMEPEGK